MRLIGEKHYDVHDEIEVICPPCKRSQHLSDIPANQVTQVDFDCSGCGKALKITVQSSVTVTVKSEDGLEVELW